MFYVDITGLPGVQHAEEVFHALLVLKDFKQFFRACGQKIQLKVFHTPNYTKAMIIKKQSRISLCGVSEAARKLGCSPSHLRRVITGERPSKRLVARAREMGIRLPKW